MSNRRALLPRLKPSMSLAQIATGLASVQEVVHRDLKPENVLLHEKKWKIADFGIARFVEESTSAKTLRGFLSPPYAAPEQWESKPCDHATDIYALGCIAHFLLAGAPPFGVATEGLADAHLRREPPRIGECGNRLNALVSMMLRKQQLSRPPIARVLSVLAQLADSNSNPSLDKGFKPLQEAAANAAREAAEREAVEMTLLENAIDDRFFTRKQNAS